MLSHSDLDAYVIRTMDAFRRTVPSFPSYWQMFPCGEFRYRPGASSRIGMLLGVVIGELGLPDRCDGDRRIWLGEEYWPHIAWEDGVCEFAVAEDSEGSFTHALELGSVAKLRAAAELCDLKLIGGRDA